MYKTFWLLFADENNNPHTFEFPAVDLNAAVADVNEAHADNLRLVMYRVR